MRLLDEWNKQPFSIYTSEERGILGLLKRLGKWVGKVIEQLDFLDKLANENKNKKVSYEDMEKMYNFYKDLESGKQDYRGSWFGIPRPEYAEPGIQGQVTANRENIEIISDKTTYLEKTNSNKINVKKYFNVTADTNNLSHLLQEFINNTSSPRTLFFESGIVYKLEEKILLNKYITIEGENNNVVIKSLKNGCFYTIDSTPFLKIKNIKLEGSGLENEIGIDLNGGSGGNAKLVLSDILVSKFGGDGIKLTNCWDSALDNVNASENKGNGLSLLQCFSTHLKKVVAWRNEKKGIYLQDPSGSLINGTSQENGEEGVLSESSLGCTYQMYLEQNGFKATVENNKSQFRLTQKPSGATSNGNTLNIYAIGGKDTDMPSKYGVYIDYAKNTIVNGEFFNHIESDVYFTTNSYDNKFFGNRENRPNGTPNSLTNYGRNYFNVQSKNGSFIQTLSTTSLGSGARTVNYPYPLNKIPIIVGTVGSAVSSTTALNIKIGNKTKTSFDFTVTDGTQLKNDIAVNFIIIEE